MEFKDYYQIMGVAKDASPEEIKRVYRRLARKYHPDMNKESGAEAKFQELGEAYEVLKDPEKRATYDRMGKQYRPGQEFHGSPDFGGGFNGHGFESDDMGQFSDFFSAMFGGRQQRGHPQASPRSRKGQDLQARLSISVQDAYIGAKKILTIAGSDGKERRLEVAIPKGIRAGQRIRLAGQGGQGMGKGAAGDVYLEVSFEANGRYRVEGADVYMDLPIAPWEAALGAKIHAPTPTATVELNIPEGSQNGRKIRLKGRGLPAKTAGDFYYVLQVVWPKADTESIKEAYQQLQEAAKTFSPRP